jgi:hypothetical protein
MSNATPRTARRNALSTYAAGVTAFALVCWPVAAWFALTWMGF